MFLAATALEETWDKQDELLFLGPWCARYDRKDAWQPLRRRMLQDPWADPKDRLRGYREAMAAYEKALAWLGPKLNTIHGTKHSQRYWRILVGPWLVRYVHILLDRFEHVSAACALHPGLSTVSLDASSRILVRDAHQLSYGTFDDGYNLQLYSRVLETLNALSKPLRIPVRPAFPSLSRPRGLPRTAEAIGRLLSRPIWLMDLQYPRGDIFRILSHSSNCWPRLPPQTDIPAPARPDSSLRGALSDFPASGRFETALSSALGQDLPWLYLERYRELALAAQRTGGPAPRVIISANGWSYNEPFKAFAALHAERGTRLVGVQHGGGYGMYGLIWQEEFERSICDSFWCLGWSSLDGDPKLRDVPSPRLSAPLKPKQKRAGILMPAHMQVLYGHGLHSQAGGSRFEEYLADRNKFLSLLPPSARNEVSVRFYVAMDRGWSQRERLLDAFPDMNIETEAIPFDKSLAHCKLAVFDHPATTFLEAFAAGVPTLLFWRKEIWDMRPSAQPLFDRLRRAGILHDSPEEAAKALVHIAHKPAEWWNSAKTREAREDFRRRFALGDPDWAGKWAAAGEEELKLAKK